MIDIIRRLDSTCSHDCDKMTTSYLILYVFIYVYISMYFHVDIVVTAFVSSYFVHKLDTS